MSEIQKSIFLDAPVTKVWTFLTDQRKLSAWLMDNDIRPVRDQSFTFSAPPAGAWDGRILCQIIDIVEYKRLSFSWYANDIGSKTLVTFELSEKNGGTQLNLTHEHLDKGMPGSMGRHAAGWTNALKALKAALLGNDEDYDWSSLQVTYYLEAPLSDVFNAWSTCAGLLSFWPVKISLESSSSNSPDENEQFQIGDRLNLFFPTGGSSLIEVLNIEKDKFMLFSFGEYGWVRVNFATENGRTKLGLRQFGSPEDNNAQWKTHAHARGWWIFNLMNLKSVLLFGNDLRDRDEKTANALGATYHPDERPAEISHDWTNFNIYLYIDAEPENVVNHWRTVSGLKRFFIADMQITDKNQHPRNENAYFENGDEYTWRWIHDHSLEGTILKSESREVVFTFGSTYQVNVDVTPHGSGTLLHLKQSGIKDTPNERVSGSLNCRSCWIHFMINLKSQLEHGVDLRDTNPETTDSISVSYPH